MSTYNAATGSSSGGLTTSMMNGFFRLRKTFKLADLVASLKAGVAFTTSDIINAFYIPANTLVLGVGCIVHVAEGAACTIGVGDTSSTSGYLNAVNLNSTSTSVWTGHTLPYGVDNMLGKLYTAAGTIDILVNSAATDAAVFTLTALCVDLGQNDYKKPPLDKN